MTVKNIFGCFFKVGFDPKLSEPDAQNIANTFRPYIWGENGICNKLKKLNQEDYGYDLKLVLFQFYVKPTSVELLNLKEIEPYRKREKSIGIPIIVDDELFFNVSEKDRDNYLMVSIVQKLDLLAEVVKKKKLDTNIIQLKIDLLQILE